MIQPTSCLFSDWVPLCLDDKTAQKLLWISEGGAKVARTSDAVCPYPNRPERYEHSPQVGGATTVCKTSDMQFVRRNVTC